MSRRAACALKRTLDFLAVLCMVLLAACGGGRAPVAFIPTPVACVPDTLKGAPAYPDSDDALRAAPSPERRYQLILAGRELRIARLGEVEPVIATCRQKALP